MAIKKYHESRGDNHRDICLIPISAHGTNPASASLCNMKIIVVNCKENGDIDVQDLKSKA
jgi:glycine dehydrogenase